MTYESVTPNSYGPLDSRSTDPALLKDLQKRESQQSPESLEDTETAQRVLSALDRIHVVAGADAVQDLARRVFGECTFDPPNGVAAISGEPVLFVIPEKRWNMRQLMYFSKALDNSTSKYKVSYVMPDKDHGPKSIKVCFFRGFQPSR